MIVKEKLQLFLIGFGAGILFLGLVLSFYMSPKIYVTTKEFQLENGIVIPAGTNLRQEKTLFPDILSEPIQTLHLRITGDLFWLNDRLKESNEIDPHYSIEIDE